MPLQEKILQGHILVVDDNPVNIQVIEKILLNDGYHNVDSTTDPTKVQDMYRAKMYDLVLLDIHMPELSGFDVMAQLTQDYPDDYLPILILTADQCEDTKNIALSSGAKDFINKPFERLEVLLRVRNILEVRLLHKQVIKSNHELENRVLERTQQIYDTQVNLIRCLGKAAEYRDNETGMHVIRLGESAACLARQIGLTEKQCEILRHASPMHDIGKIAIPDRILLKQGHLTPDEWHLMQKHAELGVEILSDQESELFEVAALLALTHHEKWDGTGYPRGLRGEEIPIYARIVSVCDVFDALLSSRPYKAPWEVSQSVGYIRDNANVAFDPDVVRCFEEVLDEILQIRDQYPDNDDRQVGQEHPEIR